MAYNRHQNRQRQPLTTVTDPDLVTIVKGDPVDSAKLIDSYANKIGSELSSELKAAQIRNIFGKVRQIERSWALQSDDAEQARSALRDLILLKSKLRYQAERNEEVKGLAALLSRGIDLVETREQFQYFVDFFEAILAYHKAAGGK